VLGGVVTVVWNWATREPGNCGDRREGGFNVNGGADADATAGGAGGPGR
jgi:hypothetical protein